MASTADQTTHLDQRLWRLNWTWTHGPEALGDPNLASQCAQLFSEEYGKWGEAGPHPGRQIRITGSMVEDHLDHEEAWIACAWAEENLVGYCIALRFDCQAGPVVWVTQLVVASTYRQLRVATQMMYSMWQFSDCYAWGLVTANPFAVRALETATRRPCRASVVTENGPVILEELSRLNSYIPADLVRHDDRHLPRVDTSFFIDLSDLEGMLRDAARGERRWNLGKLDVGQEWFACTFRSQEPVTISQDRLTDLLNGSDRIWIEAYEGMTLDGSHAWHRHTTQEVTQILEWSGSGPGALVLDLGCGDGRHSIELARRGLTAVGVDISEGLVVRARVASGRSGSFVVGDCRDANAVPQGDFDLVLCLYDVLGSSGDISDDQAILRVARSRLREDGRLILTVLNTSTTLTRLSESSRPTVLPEFIRALESLSPSRTMEQTGAIFDPDLLLFYEGLYYRKEQFDAAPFRLPCELVVRDRRYEMGELGELIEGQGFRIEDIRPVQAGGWDREPALDEEDLDAKELLVIASVNSSIANLSME
jgi:SAM-dependent methyltransferase